MLALAIGMTKRSGEAEEVTQEAFFRAYRDWETVGLMEHPGAWVRRVALNLAIGRWRRVQAADGQLADLWHGPASPLSSPVDA